MTKLKSLLRLINGHTTVSIKSKYTYRMCDDECLYCDHWDFAEGCTNKDITYKTDIDELFNGFAEDVPVKLTDKNVLLIDTYIQKAGKNGRMKHGTRAVIEILVKENDD